MKHTIKRWTALFLGAWLFLLAHDSAAAQIPPKREFRAAWVATVVNLDWPSSNSLTVQNQKDQLVSVFSALKANGISAVIFQVRPECDALYDSPYEPWSYWLTGVQGSPPNPYYDPLTFAVDEAHKRGMELHAWFNPYRAERTAGSYPTAASHVTNVHPEWVIQIGTLKFLDPGLPAVREYDARVIADVVRRYDVDGIHMDDYFYPYSPNQITTQDASTFANYPRGFTDIGNWRRDNINLLLRMIRDSVQAIKPFVKFGMSPFGIWKNGVPPGTTGMDAYSTIYCDAIAWLHEGSIDYLTPQLYWAFGGGQDYAKLMPWWADSVSANGRHFYPGQAAYRINDNNWAATELPNQIALNRANPKTGGSVFFRAQQGVNNNPKGFADSLRSNYYRYPALLPRMNWKDSIPPYYPKGIQYGAPVAGVPSALTWEPPNPAPDGDSASRYVVYRFDHRPAASELDDARNIVSIEETRSYTPPVPPAAPGPYYYTVTALDRNYNESDTSFILIIGPPPVPVLSSPPNASTDLPESVRVAWRTTAFTSQFQLQAGTDSTFATGILIDVQGIADTFRIVTGLEGQTTYYWRVRGLGAGGTGSYSSPFTFATGFPRSPLLVAPANIRTDVPLDTVLTWSASLSTQPVTYRVQYARSADFAALIVDTSGVTDTTLQIHGLQSFTIYFWRVRAANAIGTSAWSTVFRFRTMLVSSVEVLETPTAYSLEQNYPNPFNPYTTIPFEVPATGRVTIVVYDLLGREVETLVDEVRSPGRYTVSWNAGGRSSGVYFVRMAAGGFVAVKRMILIK
ncbi:MAG: family 10 glycosylhydrolase [Bacteroidota bacterium]